MKKVAIGVVIAVVVLPLLSRNALLHRGARNGQMGLISLALALGADESAYASDGNTPLIAAAETGDLDAVNRLLAENAKVDQTHRDTGATALMVAATLGHSEIVDVLLAAGASVSERDKDNRTAYWHAFRNRQFAIARKVHWTPRREVKVAYTGDASSTGGYGGGDESNSGGSESSSGEDFGSTEPSGESSGATQSAIASASALTAPKPPFVPQWKPPVVDSELSAEEADEALVKEGQVVDWKKSTLPGVVETKLTDEQQKIIDEAKRKKREEKKWERKDR